MASKKTAKAGKAAGAPAPAVVSDPDIEALRAETTLPAPPPEPDREPEPKGKALGTKPYAFVDEEIADLEKHIAVLQARVKELRAPFQEFPKMVNGVTYNSQRELDLAGGK